ncbi:MAG: hypothetical protein LC723_11155 [Actinobacteria bacterium]|nr:hypothetical protein [Actinomycetota bacterium]
MFPLTNLDIGAGHSVTSDDFVAGSTTVRLFGSDNISFNKTADVIGVSSLPKGSYLFHCNIHDEMHGTLDVI